ncbi:MAG: hypothetical protein V3W18_05230 [candidate division Zixibacteria bacterium]
MEPGEEYFEPIQCGTTICGTAWADGGLRDTDWYVLTVIESGMLIFSGEAEFTFELAIVVPGSPDPCVGFAVVAIGQAAEGEIITIQAPVNPGEVWIRARDSGFDSNPCGGDDDDYYITIDCLPCDDFIIIEIDTDTYPEETSWELIERESGTVVASAGPLSDPYTLHIWELCADPTLCYDWYIYDSFGDGIHSSGYYSVYGFDGERLCDGGEFAYEDVCPDIGTCVPCDYVIGDFNGNEIFNVADIIAAFSKLKTGSPDPAFLCECPPGSGNEWAVTMDVNNSCGFNVADIIAAFSKLKTGEPELIPCEECPPDSPSPPGPEVPLRSKH